MYLPVHSRSAFALLAAAAAVVASVPAWGQTSAAGGAISTAPADALESFLRERKLWGVVAAHLRDRLRNGTPDERMAAAETLGEVYVHQIAEASTADARQRIDVQARELLAAVPEADSYRLRIELAIAAYRDAEELAEKFRRRTAGETERAESERILRTIGPQLDDIVTKLNRQMDSLKRREAQGRDDDTAELKRDLDRARNLRSRANYFAGWANYYLAFVAGNPANATRAMEQFGVVLNAAPGRPATVERAKGGKLAIEHVARAALGCAMSAALLGNDVEARRWLDLVDEAEDLAPAVRDQFFSRRLIVLAKGSGWAEIDIAVRRRRLGEDREVRMLTLAEARLAAVLALDAQNAPATPPRSRALAGEIAQVAMGDLVAMGETGHVLSLVEQYGTSGLVGQGFISSFVRGLYAYDVAQAARAASGEPDNEPTTRPELANQFREAARLLKGAIETADAVRFPIEAGNARITRGLALYFAGDLDAAATELEAAAASVGADSQRETALWSAIVVLDAAVKGGKTTATGARDGLALRYIESFPAAERTVRLLLGSLQSDALSPDKVVEIMLAVPRDSPSYGPARRHAAGLLYTQLREAKGTDQDFAAMRFVAIAEEALRFDQDLAIAGSGATGREAAQRAFIQARRLAEAQLTSSTPDADRAEAALTAAENVAKMYAIDLGPSKAEFTFRRLQIAVARRSFPDADRLIDELHGLGGDQSDRADRWLYQRAVDDRRRDPGDPRARSEIIRFGLAVLTKLKETDPRASGVRESVALACAEAWRELGDPSMRDSAIRLDTLQIVQTRTGTSIRRLAELVEAAGQADQALLYWNELVAGLAPGSENWHEARYQSIRLLAVGDAPAAIDAFNQFRVFYPDLGPEPWRTRFKELERTLGTGTGPNAAPTSPGAAGGPQ